jgi:hypothetical protein
MSDASTVNRIGRVSNGRSSKSRKAKELREVDRVIRTRARKTLDIIKQSGCTTPAATRPNLYKRCVEGVTLFETLRGRVRPGSHGPFRYSSLLGQQTADLVSQLTLDNVMAVLMDKTPDQKWAYDIVLDNGVIFGSPETQPYASREEAEKSALAGLSMLGYSAEPAADYVLEPESEKKQQVRVNDTTYVVSRLDNRPEFRCAIAEE